MKGSTLESNRAAGTRLELLLFRLDGRQQFGINVFKVQEIIPYRQLTKMPGAHTFVNGIANLRGITMPIMDLSQAIGRLPMRNPQDGNIIITEYNRSVHGFLVNGVERIVHTQWEHVQPPPSQAAKNSYLTAVTIIDGEMIEILDVEKVLDQVVHASTEVAEEITEQASGGCHRVLVVDDSSVARKQVERSMNQIGVECVTAQDGRDALKVIDALAAEQDDMANYFDMIISDIEMPEMDGYMLTSELRRRDEFKNTYILLHSSISGEFNADMVKKTGADRFIQKYNPDDLAQAVLEQLDVDVQA